MELLELIRLVGLSGAIIIVAVVLSYKVINRASEVHTEGVRSKLDDTETLREFAKEDRALLTNIQNRYEIMSQKNIDLTRDNERLRGKILVFEEKMTNDMHECNQQHERMKQELNDLKREMGELRDILTIKDNKIAEQAEIIAQLRAG